MQTIAMRVSARKPPQVPGFKDAVWSPAGDSFATKVTISASPSAVMVGVSLIFVFGLGRVDTIVMGLWVVAGVIFPPALYTHVRWEQFLWLGRGPRGVVLATPRLLRVAGWDEIRRPRHCILPGKGLPHGWELTLALGREIGETVRVKPKVVRALMKDPRCPKWDISPALLARDFN